MTDTPSPTSDTTSADTAAQIVHPENALPPLTMEKLPPALREALTRCGWNTLMPVQEHALPYLLAGRELMVQSRTGSGKTGAYLLPLLKCLDATSATCQALILCPTRELALQVQQDAEKLFAQSGLSATALYGGVGYKKQLDSLQNNPHIVVGTPGRILDHLLRRSLSLDTLRVLIFDEADRMLSIGFYQDMKEIQRYLPRNARQTKVWFFSATYPHYVSQVAGEFLRDPQLLSLSQNQVHVSQHEHRFYVTEPMQKDRALIRLLELEEPSAAIIFCNTKANVHYVAGLLRGFGYNADELSADLSQSRREEVLTKVRQGQLRYLIATDVAARGLDIPEISHVIMYEPPEDPESYIHRAGRTGRAGASGIVISLVDFMQKAVLARIARQYAFTPQEFPTPNDAELATVVEERILNLLEAQSRRTTRLEKERQQRFIPLLQRLVAEQEQLDLLAMLLDEAYQKSLHQAPVFGKSATSKQTTSPAGKRTTRHPARKESTKTGAKSSREKTSQPRKESQN